MLGESLRETPYTGVLLPAQIMGWKQRLRINHDKSCHLRLTTAEVWQKFATQCEKQPLPLHAFEEAIRERHPEAVIHKADKQWCVMPFGEWVGMPKIYLEFQEQPFYKTGGEDSTVFQRLRFAQ